MEPIIVTAQFDPNPEAETSPAGIVHQSGEFRAGEV